MIRLLIATNLEPGELSRDPDEFIEVVRVSFSVALYSGNGPTGPADVRRRVSPAKIRRPLGGTMRVVGCLKLEYFPFNRSGTERAMLTTQGLRIEQGSRAALGHNGAQ